MYTFASDSFFGNFHPTLTHMKSCSSYSVKGLHHRTWQVKLSLLHPTKQVYSLTRSSINYYLQDAIP